MVIHGFLFHWGVNIRCEQGQIALELFINMEVIREE